MLASEGLSSQHLTQYANFLVGHQQADKAEQLLSGYLEKHPDLADSDSQFLYALADAAGKHGNQLAAQRYFEQAKSVEAAGPPGPRREVLAAVERERLIAETVPIDRAYLDAIRARRADKIPTGFNCGFRY